MHANGAIRFVLDGEIIEVAEVDPTRTVLQFLREDLRRKGTKEGCAEGDCGACTVVVAELLDDGVSLKAINSCIQFLPTLDGKQLITIESLSDGESLHPVQEAMVNNHGSQCGFCTPGFIMSMFALYETNPAPDRQAIDDALSGNLCRCTGYRPIIAAASEMNAIEGDSVTLSADVLATVRRQEMLVVEHAGRVFHAPRNCDELARLLLENPDATILAGGTDVGLWVTKQHRELQHIIYTGHIDEMLAVDKMGDTLRVGGAATLSDAVPAIVKHYPGLTELFRRFASPPIRNAGTLGGNIANGSPIGDSMAALMVIDTLLVLRRGEVERELPLADFYHDYMVNDLQPGEFIAAIKIPLRDNYTVVRSHKWSKRFDQDISAVCAAYSLHLDGGTVAKFQMACGGLAATVKRARKTEASLVGKVWSSESVEAACAALEADFSPIGDMRASADARLQVVQNLLRRFFLEQKDGDLETVYTYGRQG